jgi:hypothetical protein
MSRYIEVSISRNCITWYDRIKKTLRAINEWMASRNLELAHQKSEAVILFRKRVLVSPQYMIGGHQIPMCNEIRYLGVIIKKMSDLRGPRQYQEGGPFSRSAGQTNSEYNRYSPVTKKAARLRHR